jgi:hypothetical protein
MIRSCASCLVRNKKIDDSEAMHVAAARSFGSCCFSSMKLISKRIMGCVAHVDCLLKALGPILVLGGSGLISFCTITWFWYVMPGYSLMFKIPLCIIGVLIAFNIFFNYYHACVVDAGRPPDPQQHASLYLDALEVGRGGLDCYSDTPQSVNVTVCGKCGLCKPQRAHHCSVCKRCVLKMDHHCPWVNNCVGHGNYRFFVLFMFWLEIGCFFFAVTSLADFVRTIWGRPRYRIPPQGHYHRTVPDGPLNPNSEGIQNNMDDMFFDNMNHMHLQPDGIGARGRQCLLFATIMSVSIGIALGILLGVHVYLVATNQTTIEFQQSFAKGARLNARGESYRNPYDLGRSRNFQSVFGPYTFLSLRWALPRRETYGNGLEFPTLSASPRPNE